MLAVANGARAKLTSDISLVSTTFTVDDGSEFPTANMHVTIWSRRYLRPMDDPGHEIKECTRSGNTFTIVGSAKEGTSASTHEIGDSVGIFITAYIIEEMQQYVIDNAIQGPQGDPGPAVSDGDKGDIVVSSSGTVYTIDSGVVTNAKSANVSENTIKGRISSGTGSPEDLTATQVRTIINVENGADVTDATNVAAAGAVMESDTSTASMNFVIDEDNMASNSATKVPTQQSVKAYVDAQVVGSGISEELAIAYSTVL